ncbi:Cyanovirin-N [Aspergillus granulosus]|uniref:Cyanovirin-N n=1 Tax=Aspergillus granulosus TaxID=176169 RepID=A0ABR4GTP7_9EURO
MKLQLALALSLLTLKPLAWAADYLATCSDCRLASSDPPTLTCICQSLDGDNRTTQINLNTCIINAGGILRRQRRGNFGASCESLLYTSNGDLKALCRNGVTRDSDNWITISLNDVLSNFDGNLGC